MEMELVLGSGARVRVDCDEKDWGIKRDGEGKLSWIAAKAPEDWMTRLVWVDYDEVDAIVLHRRATESER